MDFGNSVFINMSISSKIDFYHASPHSTMLMPYTTFYLIEFSLIIDKSFFHSFRLNKNLFVSLENKCHKVKKRSFLIFFFLNRRKNYILLNSTGMIFKYQRKKVLFFLKTSKRWFLRVFFPPTEQKSNINNKKKKKKKSACFPFQFEIK